MSMTVDMILEIFVRLGGLVYRWFEQYVFNYFVNLGRGFEQVFAMIAIATFLLIFVFLLIRRLKNYQNTTSYKLWITLAEISFLKT